MTKALARTSLLASLTLLAIPAAASAAPTLWAGTSFNDLGSASALLSVTRDGRASVTNVQLILACTDAEDGTESSAGVRRALPHSRAAAPQPLRVRLLGTVRRPPRTGATQRHLALERPRRRPRTGRGDRDR